MTIWRRYVYLIGMVLFSTALVGQNTNSPSLELSFGKRSYRGDLGNGILNFNQRFYTTGALKGIYPVLKDVDLVLGISLARTGFEKDSTQSFLARAWGGEVGMRYHLDNGVILPSNTPVSPYISVGVGLQSYTPKDGYGLSDKNLNIPFGAGVSYRIMEQWEVFGQVDYNFNFGDRYDGVEAKPGNDHFLTSALGIRYHLSRVKDADHDGIPDKEDRCPHIKGPKRNHGCPYIKENAKKVFKEAVQAIHFEVDKDIIKPESYPILDRIVQVMNQNPHIKLTISGHTDSDGSAEHNLDLSRRRANAVKAYLVNKKISSARIKTAGYGESVPISNNNTIKGKALNRRVEFEIRY